MRLLRNMICVSAVSAALASCSTERLEAEAGYDYGEIRFSLSNVTVSGGGGSDGATKAGGELKDLTTANIRIYAMKDASTFYNNMRLQDDGEAGTDLWMVNPDKPDTWAAGSSYSFYGYTASTPFNEATGNYTNISGLATLSTEDGVTNWIYSNGMSFTVTQPSDYSDPQGMVDYLLSYNYRVADGTARPVVRLDFEHVLPMVEIAVVKDPLITSAYVSRLSLKGVYNSSTMRCTNQANYGSRGTNVWESLPTTTGGLTREEINYERSSSFDPEDVSAGGLKVPDSYTGTEDDTYARMTVMTVPQQLAGMAQIEIEYWVNEKADNNPDTPDNYVVHTKSFQLYNHTPYVWESGHRIRYTITLDTGISLVGRVIDWKDVDFIEGVVLPEIKAPSQQQ